MKKFDIYKAGGILIKDRKLLVEKSFGKPTYNAPGGKLEANESSKEALLRELNEEFQIKVLKDDIHLFGTFYANASGQEDKTIRMDVYVVTKWNGKITPSREIQEVRWVNSKTYKSIPIGSIFEHEVLPRLILQNLVD